MTMVKVRKIPEQKHWLSFPIRENLDSLKNNYFQNHFLLFCPKCSFLPQPPYYVNHQLLEHLPDHLIRALDLHQDGTPGLGGHVAP